MKLSYRDRVILIVVIVLACLLGGFFGLIKPKWDEAKRNESALAQKRQEQEAVQAKINSLTELNGKLRELRTENNQLHDVFLPMMTSYEIDDFVALYLVKNNLKTEGMDISTPATEPLNYYSPEIETLNFEMLRLSDINNRLNLSEDNNNFGNTFQEDADEVLTSTVSVEFSGTYEDMVNFLEEIYNMEKTIIVSGIEISSGAGAGEGMVSPAAIVDEQAAPNTQVSGAMIIKLYMLPAMAEGER